MKKFKQFMLAALVVGFGYPVSAWAFGDTDNSSSSSSAAGAAAIGAALATGGTTGAVSASANDGDTLSLGIPGAPPVPVGGDHKCALSDGWGTPIFTINGQKAEAFCMLVWQKNETCGAAELLKKAKATLTVSAEINARCGELVLEVANWGKTPEEEQTADRYSQSVAMAGGPDETVAEDAD